MWHVANCRCRCLLPHCPFELHRGPRSWDLLCSSKCHDILRKLISESPSPFVLSRLVPSHIFPSTMPKPYEFQPCAHHVDPGASGYPVCPDSEYPTPECLSSCSESTFSTTYQQDKRKAKEAYSLIVRFGGVCSAVSCFFLVVCCNQFLLKTSIRLLQHTKLPNKHVIGSPTYRVRLYRQHRNRTVNRHLVLLTLGALDATTSRNGSALAMVSSHSWCVQVPGAASRFSSIAGRPRSVPCVVCCFFLRCDAASRPVAFVRIW